MKNSKNPLNGKNIIITRSQDKISEVQNKFNEQGARILDFPTLIINYPDNLEPLDSALANINSFHWIIFSSSNGIKFLQKRLAEKNSSLNQFISNIKIAVVGEKTLKTLNELGIKANFVPPDFIAESLINHFPHSVNGLSILLPRVQTGGRDIISTEFKNAGARVVEVAAYESRCPNSIPKNTIHAIKQNKVDAILFSSGKTVKNAAYLLEKYFGKCWASYFDNVKILSIGPQTSLSCMEIFGRVDKQANIYTFEGLLDATLELFG